MNAFGRQIWNRAQAARRRVLRLLFAAMQQAGERGLARVHAAGARNALDAELAYWRWFAREGQCEAEHGACFEEVFGRFSRERMTQLARFLGLPGDAAFAAWSRRQRVVEIGGGPYPSIAAAPGWRCAVAVDPLAREYAQEGLVPPQCEHVVCLAAAGENIPLVSGSFDLVVADNCLDHVRDPSAVAGESARLLRTGGWFWLFVDFSKSPDDLHPHSMDRERLHALFCPRGLQLVREEVYETHAHPNAYASYRGLWRKDGCGAAVMETGAG